MREREQLWGENESLLRLRVDGMTSEVDFIGTVLWAKNS